MTLNLACPCGNRLTLASGHVARRLADDKPSQKELAERKGWQADPPLCPQCQGEEPPPVSRPKGGWGQS